MPFKSYLKLSGLIACWFLLAQKPVWAAAYNLPVIAPASDGVVVDSHNQSHQLVNLMGDKLVLLSFIYASCSDVNGCPLATRTLQNLGRALQNQPELAAKLRILTLSFNPIHDTPERMAAYGSGLNATGLDWQFLTTRSEQQLQPIVDAYQQSLQKIYDANGQFTGNYAHLLRVYLIDSQQQIRNIYSVDFLNVENLLSDIQVLLAPAVDSPAKPDAAEIRLGPGDDKVRYQAADYQTRSLALDQRQGQAANLIQFALKPPLGLPKLAVPADNPLTTAKIALGRQLFYDRRLSLNNTFSCAMCHIPEQGFSSNEMATAVGVEGRSVRRNTPSLYNVAYAQLLFHDGRENSLEQQVWGPLLAHNEMANPAIGYVVDKIKALPEYQARFEAVFKQPANMLTIGQALASYQRTLNSADSGFDRWYYGQQAAAISAEAQRGFRLFTGKAGCVACHQIDAKAALFTDQKRHNTGIGYAQSMNHDSQQQSLQIAPGVAIAVDRQALKSLAEAKASDLGYYEVSQNPVDRWTYKTPSLRNVALSAPYMHNGSLSSLEQVLDFYNQGGFANPNLSPLIKPLGLSAEELSDLRAFLVSLTGSNVENLVSDGFAAPVADSH